MLPKPGGQSAEIVEQGAVELPRVEDVKEACVALAQPLVLRPPARAPLYQTGSAGAN